MVQVIDSRKVELVALPGISLMPLTYPNNTGKTETCKGVRENFRKTKSQ